MPDVPAFSLNVSKCKDFKHCVAKRTPEVNYEILVQEKVNVGPALKLKCRKYTFSLK